MKRALAACFVALYLLSVACSPFEGSGGGNALDGGPEAGAPDASDFCAGALACDPFEASYRKEWGPVSGDLYQPYVDPVSGMLVCAMSSNAADAGISHDACQLERALPANVAMRIEFDLTFFGPNDYRGHNIQVFAIYNGTGATRTYLGLYVQNPSPDKASIVLSIAHLTGGSQVIADGVITYGVKTHLALDVSFGSWSAVLFDSAGATAGKQEFSSSDDQAVMELGPSRQNGGTDGFRAEYDNFRVTKLVSF